MKRAGLLTLSGAVVGSGLAAVALVGLAVGVLLIGCAQVESSGDPPRIPETPCQGLGCSIARCGSGKETRLRGKVTVPNGVDPLSRAVVYVPESGQLTPLPSELSCELCRDPIRGRAVTFSYTGLDGRFELRGVPSGDAIPVVVQKGRFRRMVKVRVPSCETTELAAEQTRLPRNRTEGDLPKLAVATGDHDAIECVLRQIGVDGTEFQTPDKPAAVHLYNNQKPGSESLPGQPLLPTLLTDRARLLGYQMVFLNCSGIAYSQGLLSNPAVRSNLVEFLSKGGRLYATDWSYDFVQQLPELAPFVCFEDDKDCSVTSPHGFHSAVASGGLGDPITAAVTPQAAGLRDFLSRLPSPVDASKVPISELLPGWVQIAQTAQDPQRFPSSVYLKGVSGGKERPLTLAFEYPPQAGCGRVLFSSYHTRERASAKPFPTYCPLGSMLPQEHILEYLLFELADCLGVVN